MWLVLVIAGCGGEPGGARGGERQAPELADCAPLTVYADSDGDGYGREHSPHQACLPIPEGFSFEVGDCDDADPAVHPNAVEICDVRDNDCDTEVDEGVTPTWFLDADSDGFGDSTFTYEGCIAPDSFVAQDGDCDDMDAASYPGPLPSVFFKDRTVAAGLHHLQWDTSGEVGPCTNAPMGGGAAVGDVDGDLDLDVFFPRMYATDLLLINDGSGVFTEAGAAAGLDFLGSTHGGLFFDVEGDGDLDLFVTSIAEHDNRLYINDGTGSFTEETEGRGLAMPVLDGMCAMSMSASAADFDLDGDLDLHTTSWDDSYHTITERTRLLENDGTGRFTDVTVAVGADLSDRASFASQFGDGDGDGWPDLFVVADWSGSALLRNTGGAFSDVTDVSGVGTDENGMGGALADFDGDGDLDWFVSSISSVADPCPDVWGCTGNRLFLNDGALRFEDATDAAGLRDGGWGWGAAAFDHDNDGHLDVVAAAGFPNSEFLRDPLRLWHNLGGARFVDVACDVRMGDVGQSRAVLPFDADRDGDLDVFVVRQGDTPRFFQNEGGNAAGWLTVALSQTGANPFGVGSVIRATRSDGVVLRRDLHANSAYLAGPPPEVHLGLAGAASVDLEITWPDGVVQIESAVAGGQAISIPRSL
jgi:enediyne biosynthesis protein E4